MKSAGIALVALVLGVSLWFNWRSFQASASAGKNPVAAPPLGVADVPGLDPALKQQGPVVPDTGNAQIDFSGTGLSDTAWQLETESPAAPAIPSKIPSSTDLPEAPKPALPPVDLDSGPSLKLSPGPD